MTAALLLIGALAAPPDTTLVRREPDRARDSLQQMLRLAVAGAEAPARSARDLAAAWGTVWGDDFHTRRVTWALRLPAPARRRWLAADSLRRAGNALLFSEGPAPARAAYEAAARHALAIGDSVGLAQAQGNLGAALFEAGALDSAALLLERARRAATRTGDRRTAANAANILASIALERGQLPAALAQLAYARAEYAAAADRRGEASALNTAALIAEEAGDLASAERDLRAALALAQASAAGDRAGDYELNLGVLAQRRGDASVARDRFTAAAERYRASGEHRNGALAQRNLGVVEAERSDWAAAVAAYQRAIALAARSRDVALEADARRLLASALGALGRLDDALDQAAQADELAARAETPDAALAAGIAVVRGDLELLLNRAALAEGHYARGERAARRSGDPAQVAEALQGRAMLAQRRDDHATAIRLLEPLRRAQPAGRARTWTSTLLGQSRAATGDTAGARADLDEAAEAFRTRGDGFGAAVALGALAELDTRQTRYARALARYDEALSATRGLPAARSWLMLGRGRTREAAGDLAGAAAAYDSAVALVERWADGTRYDDRRALVLEDKWAPYAAQAALAARRGDAQGALAASERMRARALLDLLARGPGAGTRTPLAAEAARLQQRIARLGAEVMREATGRRGGEAPSSVAADELRAAQAAYQALLERARRDEPGALRALRGELAPVDSVRLALAPGEVLLEYLVDETRTWIFVVTRDSVTPLAVAAGRADLRTRVDFARWALEARREEPALWRGALAGLDQLLLEPVRRGGWLRGATRLLIAPHRELHYLPFEALLDTLHGAPRYLIETADVAYVPSASAWLRLRARPAATGRGVLALAPQPATLAGTVAEVEAIGAIWGAEATVLVGPAARERTLREAGGRYRIVHLATRGVLDRVQPLFSWVEFGGAGAAERLDVHEAFELALPVDLLVLTACQTALGAGAVSDVPGGDDWVGLVRAFLQAGANAVLATLWAVDDRRTAEVAAAFHRGVAGGAAYDAALAAAKRQALRDAATAAPWFWAGLILTGRPASN